MVTAGHCNPVNVGLEVQSYPNGIHIGERTLSTLQKGVGTVKIPGQSAVYGDLSLMTIITKLTAPSIFIGGRDSDVKRNVEGCWGAAPKVGDLFCIGGAETGQSRNWKVQDISDQYRSYVEGPAGDVYVEAADQIRRLKLTFERLVGVCLSPEESAALVAAARSEHVP